MLFNYFDNVYEENQFIVDTINQLKGMKFDEKGTDGGLDYSDFVILLRRWKKAESICDALKQADIPYIVDGIAQLFRSSEVSAAQGIFNYLNNSIDSDMLVFLWTSLSDKIDSKN